MNRTFGVSKLLKFALVLGLVCTPVAGWFFYVEKEPVWLQVFIWTFTPTILLTWPRSIRLDEVGIAQRNLFWKVKRIRYDEVDFVSVVVSEGQIIVAGAGVEIGHCACIQTAQTSSSCCKKEPASASMWELGSQKNNTKNLCGSAIVSSDSYIWSRVRLGHASFFKSYLSAMQAALIRALR